MNKSSDILLSLEGKRLIVSKNINNKICVYYEGSYVSDGFALKGTYGVGFDFESACDDYLEKIRGKTLVFGSGNSRKEVTVLG